MAVLGAQRNSTPSLRELNPQTANGEQRYPAHAGTTGGEGLDGSKLLRPTTVRLMPSWY